MILIGIFASIFKVVVFWGSQYFQIPKVSNILTKYNAIWE